MTPTPSPDPAAATGEGTERPDTAALLTIGDWLLRTLPGHQGAEQTAAALAHTACWIDAQPPVPPSPAPRVDRADLIERLYDANGFDDIKYHEAEVRGLLTEAADALDARAPSGPCPYIVTGDEGTSHCSLAESRPAPVERPQPEPGALVLGTEDRFHLWAKLYEIQQEAGLCRFGGRNYDPQLDHIYEEATTALAYFEPPAPTDGAPVERPDGFAGYTSCPSLPCTGTLAANCAASGDCLVGLALLHLNETCDLQRRTHAAPAPTDGEP